MTLAVACLGIGSLAGYLGGLLGLGGGLVVVPALYLMLTSLAFPPLLTMHLAVGSSLAAGVFTAATSTLAHHRRGAVRWRVVWMLAPGIVLGGTLGGLLAGQIGSTGLRVFFGLFELAVAVQMAFSLQPAPARTLPGRPAMAGVGAAIGVLSALLGIGGGTMTVPFLALCNIDIRTAVGSSAACGLPITLAGAIGHLWAGPGGAAGAAGMVPAWTTGDIYWPAVAGIAAMSIVFAPLGARTAHALPLPLLRRLFAGVVAMVGIKMLTG